MKKDIKGYTVIAVFGFAMFFGVVSIIYSADVLDNYNDQEPRDSESKDQTTEAKKANKAETKESRPIVGNTIERPEYDNMDSWINDSIKLLNAESYDPYGTKQDYEIHIASSISSYAKYYAERAENEKTVEQLNKIDEVAFSAVTESDDNRREQLLEQLDRLLKNL